MVFLDKQQVLDLFNEFEIISFKEIEEDSLTALGKMKHWHVFDVIAKKIEKGNKMNLKESNEITVRIKGKLNDFYKILEEKGFKIVDEFSMDDTYLIPATLDLDKMKTREILSRAVLVRNINKKMLNKIIKKLTFKIKNFDECGNILNQEAINCDILDIEDAKRFLKAIGYKEIMNIKEDDVVYERDGFQLAIKNVVNGDNLIEIETEENENLDNIEKLIRKINEIDIPIYKDNYFVKKAEIELNKVLNRNEK